jgi:hypothetical protein
MAILFLFLGGLMCTSASDALYAATEDSPKTHSKGVVCPDPGENDEPCGPDCPCDCCPGHVNTAFALTVNVQASILFPPPAEVHLSMPGDLHPQDALVRIFHPPRA